MKRPRSSKRDSLVGLAMILPAVVVLLAFHILRLLYVGVLSFRSSDPSAERQWTTEQYVKCFTPDPLASDNARPLPHAFAVTAWYVAGTVPVTLALGLLIALLLTGDFRGRTAYRMIYFLPFATSSVAAAAAWRWIFHREPWGIANALLYRVGAGPAAWTEEASGVFNLLAGKPDALPLAGPSLALVTCMVFAIWHALGFNVVIFMAGLARIPNQLYEAATVDGAGPWTRFWRITFPLLGPTTFFLTVIMTIASFQAFSHIFIMAPSQWDRTAQNVTLLIFQQIWLEHDYSFAAAVATVLFLILLLLTLIQFRVLGRKVHYT